MDESSILRRRGLQVRRVGAEIHRGQLQRWQKLRKPEPFAETPGRKGSPLIPS